MSDTISDFGRLAEVAASQAGLVSVAQANILGVNRSRLQRAARRGELTRVHTDVYRFSASVHDWPQRIRAASMQVSGSVASHEAALGLARVDRIPRVVAISVGPSRSARLSGVRIHRVCDLYDHHLTVVGGIPTTTVARAIVE